MEQLVRLGQNESPFAPAPAVLQAATTGCEQANRYPEWDALELRTAIAEHYRVELDWVVVGTGSAGVIQQTMLAAKSGEIAFSWPSFDAFPMLAQGLGRKVRLCDVRAEACDLASLEQAMGPKTALIIICTPNAPTGGLLHHKELAGFIAKVPPKTLVLIDEAYGEFVRDPQAARALELAATFPNVVVTRTFSKAYGLAGLRIGYGIAQPALAGRIRAAGVPFCVPRPAQQAAIQALRDQAGLRKRVESILKERHRMAELLRARGANVVEGHGNFIWLPLGEATETVAAALHEQGVLVKMLMPHGVRISVGTAADTDRLLIAWKTVKKVITSKEK